MVSTRIHRLDGDLYLLRLDDDETEFFEAMWSIPEGITYNAYLLVSSNGAVLLDTWRNKYRELFVEEVKRIVDLRDLKYLVVHHMEPDHSGALAEVVKANPDITVIGHPLANQIIKSFYGVSHKFVVASDGAELELSGYRFIPWVHWPETIVSYLVDKKIVFSCDAFGAYSRPSKVYYDELDASKREEYKWYMKKYLANIVGHYMEWVSKALDKLERLGLDIELITPSHGVLWKNPGEVLRLYRGWSKGLSSGKVVIVYSSMYGFVEEAIKEVAKALDKEGISYSIHGFYE